MANSQWLLLLCLARLVAMAAATQFRVGDSMGWTVPTDANAISYNQWAERNRCVIGDSLLFVYPPDSDSVILVDQDAYNNCNTSNYIQRFEDGNTVFTFNRSGPYYFISGHENNCLRNESMVVAVMADRDFSGSDIPPALPPSPPPAVSLPSSPPSPPPSPAEVLPPPAMEVPPAPAAEVTPSPAPSNEHPAPSPPNAASLKLVGFLSSAGGLLGSLLFVF